MTDVAFSPDGKLALTSSWDNTARVWDVSSGRAIRILTGHSDWVNSVVFSPDGKFILTGSKDGTARLWDTDYRDFIRYACTRVFSDLANRQQYGITDNDPTCPQFAATQNLASTSTR